MVVLLMDLPPTIHSFIKETDGFYTIVINSRLSREMQEKCYLHELEHLDNGDFEGGDVDEIERIRHGLAG